MTPHSWRRAVGALLLALALTTTAGTAGAQATPAPAAVAVDDVDRVERPESTFYVVDYEPGIAMRLDALLFGSDDLERALVRDVGAPDGARFRSLTMDRAVLVER